MEGGAGGMPMGQQLSWLQNFVNRNPYQGPALPAGSPGGMPSGFGNPAGGMQPNMGMQQPNYPSNERPGWGGFGGQQYGFTKPYQAGPSDQLSAFQPRMMDTSPLYGSPITGAMGGGMSPMGATPQTTSQMAPGRQLVSGGTMNPDGSVNIARQNGYSGTGQLAPYANPDGSITGPTGTFNGQNMVNGQLWAPEGLSQDPSGQSFAFNNWLRQYLPQYAQGGPKALPTPQDPMARVFGGGNPGSPLGTSTDPALPMQSGVSGTNPAAANGPNMTGGFGGGNPAAGAPNLQGYFGRGLLGNQLIRRQ